MVGSRLRHSSALGLQNVQTKDQKKRSHHSFSVRWSAFFGVFRLALCGSVLLCSILSCFLCVTQSSRHDFRSAAWPRGKFIRTGTKIWMLLMLDANENDETTQTL